MLPKPKHLGLEYAEQFKDSSVVEAYHHRPPYPAATFTILADLIVNQPRYVLDVGCGSGDIARRLLPSVDRIDAVDFSAAMIEKGKRLPAGADPKLHWIEGPVEEVMLDPPYALITAGSSLHWMDWAVVLPRFQKMLMAGSYLALVSCLALPMPFGPELQQLINTYSTNRDYQPYDLVAELEKRRLFRTVGETKTAPEPFEQTVDGYIESIHARNGFSRQRMSRDAAEAFDVQAAALLERYYPSGRVPLQIVGTVTWGLPTGR